MRFLRSENSNMGDYFVQSKFLKLEQYAMNITDKDVESI